MLCVPANLKYIGDSPGIVLRPKSEIDQNWSAHKRDHQGVTWSNRMQNGINASLNRSFLERNSIKEPFTLRSRPVSKTMSIDRRTQSANWPFRSKSIGSGSTHRQTPTSKLRAPRETPRLGERTRNSFWRVWATAADTGFSSKYVRVGNATKRDKG